MRTLLILLVLGWVPVAQAYYAVGCGQEIPANQTGFMTEDLVCDGPYATSAIVLRKNARLQMNGHTITVAHPDGGVGIVCPGSCKVLGPGAIIGSGNLEYGTAILSDRGRLTLDGVEISAFADGILQFPQGKLAANNVGVHDCAGNGIVTGGLEGEQIFVQENGGAGIKTTGKVKAVIVTATGNRIGIQSGRGITGTSFTVTGNGHAGVVAERVTLLDSTLTGNDQIDVGSATPPKLRNTPCDHSVVIPNGGTWGVCRLD